MTTTNYGSSGSTHVEEPQSIELLQWAVTETDDEVGVMLAGEVDHSTGEALGELLSGVLDAKPARVVVDLAQVSFFDSTGINRLLTAAQAATDVGCTLHVRNPSGMIMRVLKICGVDEFLLEDARRDCDQGAPRS